MESRVFCCLAYFVVTTKFNIESTLQDGLQEMASGFEDLDGYDTESIEALLKPVEVAIARLKPRKIVGKLRELTAFSKDIAKDVVNVLYVEYACRFNPNFKVTSS